MSSSEQRRSSVFGKILHAFKGPESDKPASSGQGSQTKTAASASKPVETDKKATAEASAIAYDVKGKTAIVTGAGSGINHRFAKLLLSKGCNVLIADLALRPEAQELIDEYNGTDESKPRAAFAKTDVTIWAELSAMFHACYSTFGALDIVCPGAGVFEPHWSNFWHPPGSTESKDPIDGNTYKLFDINVTHPVRATQIAIAEFLNPSKGEKVSVENPKQIVFISSIAGQVFSLSTPMYIASKHAINGFIRSLAPLETELGIKCTGVAPGIVKTPLWTDHPEKMIMVDEEKEEWVTPEEVAEAMLKCVESPDVPAGTILEVGQGYTRKVEPFNDPGPMGRRGIKTSHAEVKSKEVFEWLAEDGWGKKGL
ncbi:NAD(P)-binding protein [Rhizodiscina lignyota]|uniref:NAD(P)-binding protein n=1 Tax=Rhizodiscina lignyota TaxID=1504668 RepID=A0A9P4IMY1_9PEZI|nr:NAD(P)-binding protein [Rhizodiscina lignyota]